MSLLQIRSALLKEYILICVKGSELRLPALCAVLNVVLNHSWHRTKLRSRAQIYAQTVVFSRLDCLFAKTSDSNIALLEIREVLKQRIDSFWTEEYEQIIVESLVGTEIVAHSVVHHSLAMEHAETVKPVLDIVGMNRRLRKEILLSLMLNDVRSQILHLACRADKNLTLSVLDILHDIVRYSLRHAEILHVVRNVNSQVLAKIEEMIDSMTRGEHDSCMVENGHFLLSELSG